MVEVDNEVGEGVDVEAKALLPASNVRRKDIMRMSARNRPKASGEVKVAQALSRASSAKRKDTMLMCVRRAVDPEVTGAVEDSSSRGEGSINRGAVLIVLASLPGLKPLSPTAPNPSTMPNPAQRSNSWPTTTS